jgi:prophage regulatory protein
MKQNKIEPRILSNRTVCCMTGLSRVTLWRLIRNGLFPQSRRISPGRVGFFADEIEAWLESKRAAN